MIFRIVLTRSLRRVVDEILVDDRVVVAHDDRFEAIPLFVGRAKVELELALLEVRSKHRNNPLLNLIRLRLHAPLVRDAASLGPDHRKVLGRVGVLTGNHPAAESGVGAERFVVEVRREQYAPVRYRFKKGTVNFACLM